MLREPIWYPLLVFFVVVIIYMKIFPYMRKGMGYRAAAGNALMESMSLIEQVFGN